MQAPHSSGQVPQHSGGPRAEQRVGHPRTELPAKDTQNRDDDKYYRWVEGECLKEYSNSATKWTAHTSTQTFVAAFNAIATAFAADNDVRTAKIEEFLLREAESAGVVNQAQAQESQQMGKTFSPMVWHKMQSRACTISSSSKAQWHHA